MSTQPPTAAAHVGKVTVLNSGELQVSTAAADSSGGSGVAGSSSSKNPRRKVGTTFERSFEEAPRPQTQQAGGSRTVLKAGKGVASAPAAALRPMTDLEKEFAKRPEQDQRWLLSFPLALKQLYFSFAEAPNHDQILGGLITRFPELLQGNEQNASAIQVAIQRGNWGPALRFINACADEKHKQLLRQECQPDERTFLALAVDCAARLPSSSELQEFEAARQVIVALMKTCPDLLTVTEIVSGRNALHGCAEKCPDLLLLPLMEDLLAASRDNSELASRLSNALVARDNKGRRPADAAASESGRQALSELLKHFPQDEAMLDESQGVRAIEELCSALSKRSKSQDFVSRICQLIPGDYRLILLGSMEKPVETALKWLKDTNKTELKLALAQIGQSDLASLIDRM